MKICPNCQTEQPLDAVVCPDCGQSLTPAAAPDNGDTAAKRILPAAAIAAGIWTLLVVALGIHYMSEASSWPGGVARANSIICGAFALAVAPWIGVCFLASLPWEFVNTREDADEDAG